MLPANTRERNPISQLTSRIPDILHPSPAPSPRTASHPQRFELITLASIGRFHIYMLLTRALACNGNWVSRSTHERVGQMDRSLCPTILHLTLVGVSRVLCSGPTIESLVFSFGIFFLFCSAFAKTASNMLSRNRFQVCSQTHSQ